MIDLNYWAMAAERMNRKPIGGQDSRDVFRPDRGGDPGSG
jgi:hypothetical protein